ncbi:MAG TPA: aromatic/alkene monooxygenase hydroxylase subunit beta [Baekduia sp.]|jgi:propane 2-monooxygenase small subunit
MSTTEAPAEKTTEKVRSVPKPVFTDAEAGAREFPSSTSRKYNYFESRKRKATVYEDVTVDVQPDPERHLSQGWIYGFANGDMGYPKEWTDLRSSNWHLFLDPNEEWEQTIYRNSSSIVRQVQGSIANAKAAHSFDNWNKAWTKIVERHVGAWAHAEHGLGLYVYTPAQRDGPTNMINNALAVAATHKLRFAQDLILYNLELSDLVDGFDGQAHIATWQSDPVWAGVRETVEQITATRDWAEQFFATALVFEPLVGELFRSHFVMQVAALHGDFVTPTILGGGESDAAREQRGARHLFELLIADEEYGEANTATLNEWAATWAPRCAEAAHRLQPIWSQVSEKTLTFQDSLDRAEARFSTQLSDLGLTTPEGA